MNQLPISGYTKHVRQGRSVFEVDMASAIYKGIPWSTLGRFGRRKYENLIFLNHREERPAFRYL